MKNEYKLWDAIDNKIDLYKIELEKARRNKEFDDFNILVGRIEGLKEAAYIMIKFIVSYDHEEG